MKRQNPDCPCGSGARYAACCRRFHRGEEPEDAVTLMRSRFAAYALGEVAYLWRTLHPAHPDRQEDEATWLASLRAAGRTLRFARLRVLEHDETHVRFHAEVYDGGKERSFLERSTFAREHGATGGWRYLDGAPEPKKASELG